MLENVDVRCSCPESEEGIDVMAGFLEHPD